MRPRWACRLACIAIIPIGHTMGQFGPVGRGAPSEIVHQDRCGNPYPGL